MKTLVLKQPFEFELTDTAQPTPPNAGEALVRVHRVGVCGTDLHAFRGKQPFFTYPRILGHELGVEVVALHPDNPNSAGFVQVGARCSVEPYLNCGVCIACRNGKTNCCTSLQCLGVHCDGGMREFITVPIRKLHPSATLSYDQLALVETLGIGAHAVDRAQLAPNENVLVVGAGPIGLATMQFAKLHTPNVIAMDVNDERLHFCKKQLGVAHTVNASNEPLKQIEALTNGDLPTAVFDATGNVHSMNNAFQFVAHGGRLVFVGLVQADVTFHDPFFHRRELTILASRNALSADFPRIVGLVERGEIDTQPWVTHRATADQVPHQFENWLKPETGVIKAMVSF